MKPIRILGTLALIASLGACAAPDLASRNRGLSPDAPAAGPTALRPLYDVRKIEITVPHSLRVSEANVFFPLADIVWRGEPRGDRYAQVQKIFEDGFARGTKGMTRCPAVVVKAEVERFHILTEKAKFFTGGSFDMRFRLTVTEAKTGKVLDGPRIVVASMPGAGGKRAIEEEARGLTQRVKIVAHLAEVIHDQLSGPVATPADAGQVSRGGFEPSTF